MTINSADYGFDQIRYLQPVYAPRASINERNERVKDDPHELLPSVKTVILLVKGWIPYNHTHNEPTISAYYPASNSAYSECARLASDIRAEGYEAVANAQIAIKPLLRLYGGSVGLNSLISLKGFGTRFHAQVILTDMAAETEAPSTYATELCNNCAGCMACVNACPAGAISKDGRVDIYRCLRAFDDIGAVPEELRPKIGSSLLGCDICQNVCPRNERVLPCEMPEDLKKSLDMRKLLAGDMGELSRFIGRNYARRTRIRIKAALIAACTMKEDCIDLLEAMINDGMPKEKEYAMWAINYIRERKL